MSLRHLLTHDQAAADLPTELRKTAIRVAHALLDAGYGTGDVADTAELAHKIHTAAVAVDYATLREIANTWLTLGIGVGNAQLMHPIPGRTHAQERAGSAMGAYIDGVRYAHNGDPRDALELLSSAWHRAEQADCVQVKVPRAGGYHIEGYVTA